MTHTKGPWEARNGEVTTQQVNGRSYRRIAAVQDYGVGCDPEVDEANARLIAAAPDLLAACNELEALFDNQGDARPYTWQERLPMLERARAAIAKAEGTT